MIAAAASGILKNLLFRDLDAFVSSSIEKPKPALSPVVQCDPRDLGSSPALRLAVQILNRTLHLYLADLSGDANFIAGLIPFLQSGLHETEIALSVLFNEGCGLSVSPVAGGEPLAAVLRGDGEADAGLMRIDISYSGEARSRDLVALLPLAFLRLFSDDITAERDPEEVNRSRLLFFKNPLRLLPRIALILATFDDLELERLFYHLRRKNLLSAYQACLIILAHPGHVIRIKNCFSKQFIGEVADMLHRFERRGMIKKRDLLEGEYSIEEAVFSLIKSTDSLAYSPTLARIQNAVRAASLAEAVHRMEFAAWLRIMDEDGLLYHTLASSRQGDIARAISDAPGSYADHLKRHLSARRLYEITAESESAAASPAERTEARGAIISTYRRLRLKKRNLADESFEFLLRRFRSADDYRNLLAAVGWYTLSTALKGMPETRTRPLMKSLPAPARYLIEDVLSGVVNPNIIHGESPVRNARAACVRAIEMLAEDGIIVLES